MKIVIVESPYRGANQSERLMNISYLNQCMRDSIMRGELPLASHKLFPGALDEDVPEERNKGIELGFELWSLTDYIVFYIDRGWSSGMSAALIRANEEKKIEIRSIYKREDPADEIHRKMLDQ